MIYIKEISHRIEDYASMAECEKKHREATAETYEEFTGSGHSWCWCLAGNIVQEHEFGEEHEKRLGTKQFARGTKVFCAPSAWGDGYEKSLLSVFPDREGDTLRSLPVQNMWKISV